jgi:sigma-B regulation protein RsbU (phosphoserine phosphatase)
LAWLNAFLLRHSPTERFVTAAWLDIDPTGTRVRHAVAGHAPPLLLRPDGAVVPLAQGGIPIGMFADAEWDEGETTIAPGDRIVLYTDGVVEAAPAGDRDRAFGLDRLVSAARAPASDAESACEHVFAALDAWTEGAGLRDDATVVLLARPA